MSQPLHLTLRLYRIPAMVITLFAMYLANDMWEWFKVHSGDLNDWSNASFMSLSGAVMMLLKWSLENFAKRQERDDGRDS